MNRTTHNSPTPLQAMPEATPHQPSAGHGNPPLLARLAIDEEDNSQAGRSPVWSDQARQAWLQTRLRYPAMGMCRR